MNYFMEVFDFNNIFMCLCKLVVVLFSGCILEQCCHLKTKNENSWLIILHSFVVFLFSRYLMAINAGAEKSIFQNVNYCPPNMELLGNMIIVL